MADDLIGDRRILYGLFFVHLALEKMLKAHVWRVTQEAPPRIHNPIRLAELARMTMNEKNKHILAEINEFNIEGRYSDLLILPPSQKEAREYPGRAKGVFEWLTSLF